MQVQSLDREDPLEEGMATHFSILAWRIPWTMKPEGLQPESRTLLKQLSIHPDCSPLGSFVGFPRQGYWSGLPFPSPWDLPDPGMEPGSTCIAGKFFTD